MLETPRLLIRPFQAADASALYDYLSNPLVYRFEPGEPISLEKARELALKRSQNNDFWAVVLKDTGTLVGHLYFKQSDPAERLTWELGYIFNPACQSRGYATEASAALLRHAFEHFGMLRVVAHCNPENIASWRVMEKIGLRREGHHKKNVFFHRDANGEPLWTDTLDYALLREEFEPEQTASPRSLPTSFGMLRTWQPGDLESLVKYANNRNISANMRDGFASPYTAQNAQAFLAAVSRQDPVSFYAIATSDEAIGGIGVSLNTDVHRLTAELGYWLAEPYWGRGIATEAVLKFCDNAFERFGLLRIYAEPYATNSASCHVLQKAGFTLEGRLRQSVIKDGKILDQLLYAKLNENL